MSKIKQPEVVSAQAWKCVCGAVNGIPEIDVCASCGEWTLGGPVEKAVKPDPVPFAGAVKPDLDDD